MVKQQYFRQGLNANESKVPVSIPETSIRKQLSRFAYLLALILCLHRSQMNFRHLKVFKLQGDQSLTSSDGQHPSIHYWSAQAMVERNVSSVFFNVEEQMAAAANYSSPQPRTCQLSNNFLFYVYQDLPAKFTTDIEAIIQNHTLQGSTQENVATELALLHLFRNSPCRTYNASLASLFVVPYLHYADCFFSPGYSTGCPQVAREKMHELFQHLKWYNHQPRRPPHVFINVYQQEMSHPAINKEPIRLTTGPRSTVGKEGEILVPIFHDDPRYQPSLLQESNLYLPPTQQKPRRYAFAAMYNAALNPKINRRRQGRVVRKYFYDHVKNHYATLPNNNQTIAGLPFFATDSLGSRDDVDRETKLVYGDSILCPILPGDAVWMRRFFDVIRSGCLPVVVEWPTRGNPQQTNWYRPSIEFSKEQSYPFFHEEEDPSAIPYESFVVVAKGNTGNEADMTPMFFAMEAILKDPQELQRRQANLAKYAQRFTYGLGMDAYVYDDAFAQILLELQRYVESLGQA